MNPQYKNIISECNQGISKITLNRPPVNVMDIEMMEEIYSALQEIKYNSNVKVAVFTGTGKSFSAGVDVADHTADKVHKMIEIFHSIFYTLYQLEIPTVAVVNGTALGGGCELATFCDMVIASDVARFGQPEIKVGVFPPVAAVVFPRLTHYRKTVELLLTGDIISAQEAEKLGLVNKVVPADKLEEATDELIKKLVDNSAVIIKLTKRAILKGLDDRFDTALKNVEQIYLDSLMKTEDAHEGLQAFLEKRKPIWKNK